jgi:hypothetical protein
MAGNRNRTFCSGPEMWSSSHKTERIARIVLAVCLSLGLSGAWARAERKDYFSTSIDFVGGVSNYAMQLVQKSTTPYYSAMPSLGLRSIGRHSEFDLDYTFVGEHFQMTPSQTSTSHVAIGNFSAQLGRFMHLRLSDTFNTMPDFSVVNVLKDFTSTPQGYQPIFEPQPRKGTSIGNIGSLDLEFDAGRASSIRMSGSALYRKYDESVSQRYFSDNLRTEATVGFSHKYSNRTSWNINYRLWQNDYKYFAKTRSHAATFGVAKEVRPGVQIALEAGPSYTEQDSSISYFVDVSFSRQVRNNRFAASYTHRAAENAGWGGGSESRHEVRLWFLQSLGRWMSISLDGWAFQQNPGVPLLYQYWVASGSGALSRYFGEHWAVSIGASYESYIGRSYENYTYRRAYVSIGYRSRRHTEAR